MRRQPRESLTDPLSQVKGVREDSIDEFLRNFLSDPEVSQNHLRMVTRANQRFAQRLLAFAEAHEPMSTQEAIVCGAMVVIGLQDTQHRKDMDEVFAQIYRDNSFDAIDILDAVEGDPAQPMIAGDDVSD